MSLLSSILDASPRVHELAQMQCILANIDRTKSVAFAVGMATFAGGVLLLINHRRELDRQLDDDLTDLRARFEKRKYRRRAISSSLIASVGGLLAGLYWVNERRVFAIFVTLILTLLAAISLLAMIDFFSVGIQQLTSHNEKAEKAMLEEIIRQHRENSQQSDDAE